MMVYRMAGVAVAFIRKCCQGRNQERRSNNRVGGQNSGGGRWADLQTMTLNVSL